MKTGILVEEIIAAAQMSADAAQFRRLALGHVARAVRADAGIFLALDLRGRLELQPGTFHEDDPRRFAQTYAAHPQRYDETQRRDWAALAASRGVFHDRDVDSATERDRLPVHAGVVGPQHIVSQIVIGLRFHGRPLGQLHLERIGSSDPFQERALELLRRVVPVLELAYMAVIAGASPLAEISRGAAGADPDLASLAERFARLTPRQREIVLQVASGLETREIAAQLECSPNTVRNHLSAIFDAVGASNRTELALWAQALQSRS